MGAGVAYDKFYLFHVILVILFLLFIYNSRNGNIDQRIFKSYHYLFWIIFVFWGITSLIWTVEITYSLRYLYYLFIGILIIILLTTYITTEQRLKEILKVTIVVVIIQLIISALEIFTDFRYPLSPYSQYSYIFGRSGLNLQELSILANSYIGSTPTGFMGNPNNLAVVLLLFLPFLLIEKNKFISITFSLLTIIVLVYTGSRAGIISGMIMILIYFGIYHYKKLIMYSSLIPIFVLIFWLIFKNYIETTTNLKLIELFTLKDSLLKYLSFEENMGSDSISTRQILIKNGINALIETNYFGVGLGASNKIQELNGSKITSMHNFWVELLVENGVLIFGLFIIWYLHLLFKLFTIYQSNKTSSDMKKITAASIMSLIGLVPGAITASTVIYLLPMWLVFAISISIINLNKNPEIRNLN